MQIMDLINKIRLSFLMMMITMIMLLLMIIFTDITNCNQFTIKKFRSMRDAHSLYKGASLVKSNYKSY